jgi:hypothetical protein
MVLVQSKIDPKRYNHSYLFAEVEPSVQITILDGGKST